MAESNIIAPTLSTAIGGLSDDLFTGIDGSFFSSKNINIRGLARGISLNKALVLDSSTTITEKINKILRLTTGAYMAFGASGGIYLKATTTWAKVTTDSPATAILDACEFNGYLYRTTATYIHRILVTNISADITATDVINRQALTSASYHPLATAGTLLYVGDANKVGYIDVTNVYENGLTLGTNDIVRQINLLGGSVRLVTYNLSANNIIYLWDGIDEAPGEKIPIKGFDIRQSEIFNGYNYLVTNKGLGILDGYKIHPIKKTNIFNNNINSITVHDEKLYIGGTGGVYVFGNSNKNYPEVLNLELTASAGVGTEIIGAIYSDGTDLYVSWSNVGGTVFGIDKLSTTTYYTTGELVTRGYFGKALKDVKEAIRALVGFKPPIAGQTITISYSINGGSYTKLIDITTATVLGDNFTEDLIFSNSFQYIQFKVELAGPGTSTPEFYSIDLVFNNIKR